MLLHIMKLLKHQKLQGNMIPNDAMLFMMGQYHPIFMAGYSRMAKAHLLGWALGTMALT